MVSQYYPLHCDAPTQQSKYVEDNAMVRHHLYEICQKASDDGCLSCQFFLTVGFTGILDLVQ
jgi:hypothetical protein